MQTFLPYPDIANSLVVLDRRRLRDQRGHAKLTLMAVEGLCPVLANRPFARMWKGYEGWLVMYGLSACRFYMIERHTMAPTEIKATDTLIGYFREKRVQYPDKTPPHWLGTPAYHESHRSRLIRLAPGTYRPIWPETPENLPLVWPV